MRGLLLGLIGGIFVRAEKHEFQAEVSRLMDIIINSLYTHKEVFLRELISNSADALEKARYLSVSDQNYLADNSALELKVWFDEEARTLSLEDSGVGMTKEELIANLGTVAKSGTANFLEKISSSDTSLIGQFGVGFYSAYLVADKVQVHSKSVSSDVQYVWESSASASFTVDRDDQGEAIARGTRVVLHLKEDAAEYLSEAKLRELVVKYSQFITFPIKLRVTKERTVAKDVPTQGGEEGEVAVEDEEEEKEEETKEKYYEWETLNEQKPLWLRSKDEISEEEYSDFFKSALSSNSYDKEKPLGHTHFSAEGEVEFKALLYVPGKAPYDLMDNYWTKKSEVKLYVRRVLVADKFEDLLPRYLNFVKGIVDSDHLPLNVSREQLQQNAVIKVIGKKLTRKVLDLIKDLATKDSSTSESTDNESSDDDSKKTEEKGKFGKFLGEFGKQLKMGCYEDDANRGRIAKLLRFQSLKHKEEHALSLDQYVKEADEKQEAIYFMSGEDLEVMQKASVLQLFRKKNIDVLLLTDQLDEPCLQRLGSFESKKFVSVQKSDLKLEETDEEKKLFKKTKEFFKPLTEWWKKILVKETTDGVLKNSGIKVEGVAISKRLVEAPCTVVASQYGYSAQQEKIMKAQAFQNKDSLAMMVGRKTLEINPNHPVIQDLLNKVKDNDADKATDTAIVLFQAALLDSGYEIADASALVARVYKLMSAELGVDPEAPLQELEIPEDAASEETKEDDTPSAGDFNLDDLDLDDLDLEEEADEKDNRDEL